MQAESFFRGATVVYEFSSGGAAPPPPPAGPKLFSEAHARGLGRVGETIAFLAGSSPSPAPVADTHDGVGRAGSRDGHRKRKQPEEEQVDYQTVKNLVQKVKARAKTAQAAMDKLRTGRVEARADLREALELAAGVRKPSKAPAPAELVSSIDDDEEEELLMLLMG